MDTPSHKPIVVKGVRQCGKTSSVVDFANKHFRQKASNPYGNTPEPQCLLGFQGYKDFLFDCIFLFN